MYGYWFLNIYDWMNSYRISFRNSMPYENCRSYLFLEFNYLPFTNNWLCVLHVHYKLVFNKSKYASSTNTLYKVKAWFLFLSGLFLLILTGCQICVNSAFSPEYNVKPLNEHHDILPMPLNKLLIYVACLLLQLQKEIWRNAENVFISMYDFFILSIFIICLLLNEV